MFNKHDMDNWREWYDKQLFFIEMGVYKNQILAFLAIMFFAVAGWCLSC
jgi:hypothetical protein